MPRKKKKKRKRNYIRAFGEKKTAYQWMKDPRCKAGHRRSLASRIAQGWDPESAITTPKIHKATPIEAWGEKKNLTEWMEDSRIHPDLLLETVWNRIMVLGWKPEEAFFHPPDAKWAVRKYYIPDIPIKIPSKKKVKRIGPKVLLEAYGKRKTLQEWAFSKECVVSYKTLRSRLKRGWVPESALSTPANENPPTYIGKVPEEIKEIQNWHGRYLETIPEPEDKTTKLLRLLGLLKEGPESNPEGKGND